MKYPVNRSALHALASIGHGPGGANDNSSQRRTSKTLSKEEALERYLVSLVKENPMRLFCLRTGAAAVHAKANCPIARLLNTNISMTTSLN